MLFLIFASTSSHKLSKTRSLCSDIFQLSYSMVISIKHPVANSTVKSWKKKQTCLESLLFSKYVSQLTYEDKFFEYEV